MSRIMGQTQDGRDVAFGLDEECGFFLDVWAPGADHEENPEISYVTQGEGAVNRQEIVRWMREWLPECDHFTTRISLDMDPLP